MVLLDQGSVILSIKKYLLESQWHFLSQKYQNGCKTIVGKLHCTINNEFGGQ